MLGAPNFGGRFEPLRFAGEGGMGRVYEARDLVTGERVALKVLRGLGALEEERFEREIRALASLRRPGVVGYIAHGATPEGTPYLAMEWIDGVSLSVRLRAGALDVADALSLAGRLADALGAVHRAGMVHRDLKPGNVLLQGGDLDRPVIVDFGLAHVTGAWRLTRTGTALGTPGYMAPEQARGEPGIDARADVFALGCLLFRCLTGEDAFGGDEPLARLLRVVLEDPPRVRERRRDVPRAVDALVARLLSKPREARPRDGAAVALEIEALGIAPASSPSSTLRLPPSSGTITASERRPIALLLLRSAPAKTPGGDREDEGEARRATAFHEVIERHEGKREALLNGAEIVLLTNAGAPTDMAERAARCALAVRAALGDGFIAVALGWAEIEARVPVGEVSDRAARLLEAAEASAEAERGTASPILVDHVMARLLGPRFDVRDAGTGFALRGEHDDVDMPPLLLGRPSRCVGRDREISLLETAFACCVEEAVAGAVLVTAPAGAGKSRVRYDLLQRLRARGEPLEIWLGRGDPMGAGAAFGLLSRAIRYALGIVDSDPPAARWRRILARTSDLPDAQRVSAFLGELVGAPPPDDASPQIRAARRDPVLMGDHMRRAAEDLLRAACSTRPVILVLEDLHWGDLPSVTFVDRALRNLENLPLLVLALARPEVHGLFPRLWANRPLQTMQLGPLPRRAAERLVRLALGDQFPAEQIRALVERADGNALYLEELIRAVTEGETERPTETLLAMARTRLERLDGEARRILRAASVFGAAFSQAGVEALLGEPPAPERWNELVNREILIPRGADDRGGGAYLELGDAGRDTGNLLLEPRYEFRHALIRDAAYAMLTEDDRARGHRLAGAWLERAGEGDAIALAEHFDRGGEPARAATHYLRSAEEALQGDDLVAAIERAGRGLACGAGPAEIGSLRLVEAEAHLWRGEFQQAETCAGEAAALLPVGSARWYRTLTQLTLAVYYQGGIDREEALIGPACAATPAEDALSAFIVYLSRSATGRVHRGNLAGASALIERAQGLTAGTPEVDAQAIGALQEACAHLAMGDVDPIGSIQCFEAALSAFEKAGDRRNICSTRMNLGFALAELGDIERALTLLRQARADAIAMGAHQLMPCILQNLGYTLAMTGELDEARSLQEEAIQLMREQGHVRLQGSSRTYLAQIALCAGDAATAEREARAAVELLAVAPPLRAGALALLARALLAAGRAGEALPIARDAYALLQAAGSLEEGEALVRLVHTEALAGAGRSREAEEARGEARAWLLARAERVRDPALRERFLTRVPDHAAIMSVRALHH